MQSYQNPSKTFFIDIDKIILKFIWKGKETRIAKTILKKKLGEISSPSQDLLCISSNHYCVVFTGG